MRRMGVLARVGEDALRTVERQGGVDLGKNCLAV
jgi:hypothetical protein